MGSGLHLFVLAVLNLHHRGRNYNSFGAGASGWVLPAAIAVVIVILITVAIVVTRRRYAAD